MLPGKQYQIEDIIDIIKRHKWLIIGPWIFGSALTYVVAKALPDRYRSESTIQVVPQRVPENYVRSTVTSSIQERLPVISQQILSRTRLERIIQDFGLYVKERKTELMEDIVNQMRDDVGVQLIKGDAFQVSYKSSDAKTAMKVTERIASLFVEENLRDREVTAEGANQFLDSQLDDARRQLLDHEKKLEDYRRQYNGELPEQLQTNLASMQSAQEQLTSISESIAQDRTRHLMLERMLADNDAEGGVLAAVMPIPGTPSAGGAPAGNDQAPTGSATAQLQAAKKQLEMLQLRLKPTHPDVRALQRHVQDLEKAAEEESLTAGVSQTTVARPNPAETMRQNRQKDLKTELEALNAQMALKDAKSKKLQAAIGDLGQRADRTPTHQSELIALNRDYETLQKVYTTLLAKGQDAKVAANLERRQVGEQFKVIDAARLPEKPYSPNRQQIDLIGAFASLAFGIGIVGLLEYRDTSFRSDSDVIAVLSLPVLAIIPGIVTAAEARAIRRRQLLIGAAAGLVLVLAGTAAFVLRTTIINVIQGYL